MIWSGLLQVWNPEKLEFVPLEAVGALRMVQKDTEGGLETVAAGRLPIILSGGSRCGYQSLCACGRKRRRGCSVYNSRYHGKRGNGYCGDCRI